MSLEDAKRASGVNSLDRDGGLRIERNGLVAYAMIDAAERVGDVVIALQSKCAAIESILSARWGANSAGAHSWFSDRTGWVATLNDNMPGANCAVSFLNRSYLGVAGSRPGVLGLLGGLKREEVEKVLKGRDLSAGFSEIHFSLRYSDVDERVDYMEMDFPEAVAKAVESAWGQGRKMRGVLADEVWFDESAKYRASMIHNEAGLWSLRFEPYIPLRMWLGSGDRIAALRSPVLGRDLQAVATAYGKLLNQVGGNYKLRLPMSDAGHCDTTVFVEGDEVSRVEIDIPDDSPSTLTLLEEKWGHGTAGSAHTWTFASKEYGAVTVNMSGGETTLVLQTETGR